MENDLTELFDSLMDFDEFEAFSELENESKKLAEELRIIELKEKLEILINHDI